MGNVRKKEFERNMNTKALISLLALLCLAGQGSIGRTEPYGRSRTSIGTGPNPQSHPVGPNRGEGGGELSGRRIESDADRSGYAVALRVSTALDCTHVGL